MTEKQQRELSPLVRHLLQLAKGDDRGALAELRRGAGKPPGTEPATFRHVVPFVPQSDAGLARSWPYFCVASLFALNPGITQEGFGAAYRRLKESDSRNARFRALINAHPHDLPKLLRHAIRQLAAAEVRVNWDQLLRDLKAWTAPDRYVQRRWATEYWAADSNEPGE